MATHHHQAHSAAQASWEALSKIFDRKKTPKNYRWVFIDIKKAPKTYRMAIEVLTDFYTAHPAELAEMLNSRVNLGAESKLEQHAHIVVSKDMRGEYYTATPLGLINGILDKVNGSDKHRLVVTYSTNKQVAFGVMKYEAV